MANKKINEIFNRFIPDDDMRIIGQAEVSDLQISREDREIFINAKFEQYIKPNKILEYAKKVAVSYEIAELHINQSFNAECFKAEYIYDIFETLRKTVSTVNGFLENCECDLEDNNINISLCHGGAELLKQTRCDIEISHLVFKQF